MNLILPIYSIFVLSLLIILFFGKKKLKRDENNLYGILLIFSFFNVIFNIIGIYLGYKYGNMPFLYFLNHLDLPLYFWWASILFLYLLCVYLNDSDSSKYDKLKRIVVLLDSLFTVISLILPFEVVITETAGFAIGTCVNFVYIICGLYLLLCVVYSFMLIKKRNFKKTIPLFAFILLGIMAAIIQKNIPSLIIVPAVVVFVELIMYFTIENPDLKLLEEVHKAKEISDNANEEKTLFLYNMTNDIRSITKDIDDSADYILEEIDNKKIDKELIKDIARDIKSSTAKFTTMTNEILDISNIDTYSVKIYNNKYNIKLLLRGLITEYKEKCKEKNITFRSNIDTTLPEYLYGDNVSLKEAIDILLENSYKYTDKGYIELNVNTIIKNNIARLIITVEDSGMGMKVEELNKALNNRKEEDNTDLNNTLYNVKKLVTLMNGSLMPSSTYGSGTTIKIVLDQKIYNEVKEMSKYNKELDQKRVLLVDDNLSSQKLFTKILSGTNIELDIVSLGKECLDKIRNKEKYDLILLDEEMKPLSGIEVITKLKNIKNFNNGVILLTKNNDYEYNEEYLKYGFIDYILKPLDKTKVLDKISKYLK